jgi:hypothetical protein
VLEREGRAVCVGDQGSARPGALAEVLEDRPVTLAGADDASVGTVEKAVCELKGDFRGVWGP